ncbi:hypothetical protein PENSUB_5719 [Penicillium subrubescens]|uniref:Uncharacterized protein n=1 Tax=Penicillium subrubescens TaxID=1316194 RepID=A0A1Q5U791_9EURO|nr:hypothetical protein PENSUB_5719 [Penicillium subrubescens]
MNQVHLGYTSWNDPVTNTNVMPALNYVADPEGVQGIGVAVQGRRNTTSTYSISSDTSYVKVSQERGSVSSQGHGSNVRGFITVNWRSAKPGLSYTELTVRARDGSIAKLLLPVNKTVVPPGFTRFIE